MGNATQAATSVGGRFEEAQMGQAQGSKTPLIQVVTVTMSASYATGGDTLSTLNNYLASLPDAVLCGISSSGYFPVFVPGATPQASKIKMYSAQGTEVANTTNLSAESFVALIVGGTQVIGQA